MRKMREQDATERFISKFGPVTALRLLGYAYKMEFGGEAWLRDHVSRQQLLFIRRQFEEAEVPWGEGVIEWPGVVRGLKKAYDAEQARKAARAARRASRTA